VVNIRTPMPGPGPGEARRWVLVGQQRAQRFQLIPPARQQRSSPQVGKAFARFLDHRLAAPAPLGDFAAQLLVLGCIAH